MQMQGHGYDPVATFHEINGDAHSHLGGIADCLPGEYALVSVVGGEIFLCNVVDHDDAFWRVSAEISEGKTGAWDAESDALAHGLDDGDIIIDDLGGYERYLVYESD